MQTKNLAEEKFKQLQQLFPNAVTETTDEEGNVVKAIDKDILMQEISSEVVEGPKERYQFTWPDKKKAVHAAGAPTSNTLRPCREESVNFDETENLYIEGDNLEVLKLLQETYLGKVKMIYIDPPYNTGKDFVYNDEFKSSYDEYIQNSGQLDEEGNRLEKNLESNGRFHTDWLNMMYPRLKLARNLLTDDGVIFISIDDNEQANMKKICDEIFGEDNFINCISVKMSEASGVKMNHQHVRFPKIKEHILFYEKGSFKEFERIDKYKISEWDDENNIYLENLNYKDRQKLIKFEEKNEIDSKDLNNINKLLFKIKKKSLSKVIKEKKFDSYDEEKEWLFNNAFRIIKTAGSDSYTKLVKNKDKKFNQDIAAEISAEGNLFYYITDFNRKAKSPRIQVLFADTNLYKNPCDFWQDIKTTGAIANEGGVLFKNGKKPLKLLKRMISMTTSNDDIILDFFSGSSSTAHATLETNLEDGNNRRFIMIQLQENLKETVKKVSGKPKEDIEDLISFLTSLNKPCLLTELGKERIKRSGDEIVQKYNNSDKIKSLDIGFRVLKTDSSNMKDVYYSPSETHQDLMDMLEDNIKEDRSAEDLLFQVMLDLGISLSSKIKVETINDTQVHIIEDGFLIACFDKDIDEEVVENIAKQTPYYAIFRDSSIANDSVAANFEQIFESISPETIRKVL